MALPLAIPLGAAAIAAYLLLSGKSSAASSPAAPSGGGGGWGGPSGGGSTSSGDQSTTLGPGGSSYPLPAAYQGAPPDGSGGSTDYQGTLMGSGGSSVPSSQWDTSAPSQPLDELGGLPAASATGTAAGPGGYCDLPDGSVGVWSEHPNVLAATGGRGGWVPVFDGHDEGYAPPGGLPIF